MASFFRPWWSLLISEVVVGTMAANDTTMKESRTGVEAEILAVLLCCLTWVAVKVAQEMPVNYLISAP
jgi:hypothetical protein